MKDKILKQIENEVGRIINEAPYKMDGSGRFYGYHTITNRLIEAAKFGYNIKESVDEKLIEALKNINVICGDVDCTSIQHMKDVVQLTLEWSFNALSASKNTVSNEGIPHLDEFMKVTVKDKPIRNRK